MKASAPFRRQRPYHAIVAPLVLTFLVTACASEQDGAGDTMTGAMGSASGPSGTPTVPSGTNGAQPGAASPDATQEGPGGSPSTPVTPPSTATTTEPTSPTGTTPADPTSTGTPPDAMPMPTAPEMPGEPEPSVMMGEPEVMREPEPMLGEPEPMMGEPEPATPVDGPPNPSGLPEPSDGGMPMPSGAAGGLEVLNWAGFTAAVTYTFDDSNQTQLQNFSQMLGLGVPFTFYLWTGKQESSDAAWDDALAQGHELGNHTQSHQGSGDDLGGDTDAAQSFIMERFGSVAYTMAAPNGSTSYVSVGQTRFIINRGVADGLIQPNGDNDPFNLQGWIPPTDAGADQFNAKVDAARSGGGWQIMTIHGFTGGNDGAYQPVSLDGWVQSVEYAKSLGDVWIGTMENVGAYWLGQKAFSAATPETASDATTWTWTLPENFPPGKYLRVVVDGGTPMQDGSALPWNEHGFYEVALDTGSLTLSP